MRVLALPSACFRPARPSSSSLRIGTPVASALTYRIGTLLPGSGVRPGALATLGGAAHALHHSLNLAGGDVDAAGFAQVLFGFLIAHFIGPLQAHQPRQSRRGPFQTQRGIGWVVSLFLAWVVVVIALQGEGAKDA